MQVINRSGFQFLLQPCETESITQMMERVGLNCSYSDKTDWMRKIEHAA